MALLVVGLLTLLILNTQLAQGTYVLKDLGKREVALIDQKLELNRSIDAQRSPGSLAAKAKALGMVPASSMASWRAARSLGRPGPQGRHPQRLLMPLPPQRHLFRRLRPQQQPPHLSSCRQGMLQTRPPDPPVPPCQLRRAELCRPVHLSVLAPRAVLPRPVLARCN